MTQKERAAFLGAQARDYCFSTRRARASLGGHAPRPKPFDHDPSEPGHRFGVVGGALMADQGLEIVEQARPGHDGRS